MEYTKEQITEKLKSLPAGAKYSDLDILMSSEKKCPTACNQAEPSVICTKIIGILSSAMQQLYETQEPAEIKKILQVNLPKALMAKSKMFFLDDAGRDFFRSKENSI